MKPEQEKRKNELLQLLQNSDATEQDTISERDMLMQCQSNDRNASKTAFKQLVQRYQNAVYTYVHQMVGDETASDITRDVFGQAYRQIAHIQSDMSVKAWLFKIAKKEVAKTSRKRPKTGKMDEPSETASKPGRGVCKEICGLLSAYADGELTASETSRVEEHLAGCEQCCLEYEKLTETIDLVHTFGLRDVPANLQREIYAILDKQTLWKRWTAYYEKFTGTFRLPIPQIAVAVASLVIIFLGIASYFQHEQIRQMQGELRALRSRGLIPPEEIRPTTFVIFTGKIVSEGLPPEAAEYVSNLLPEPEKKPDLLFVDGNTTDVGNEIVQHVSSMQGTVIEDHVSQDKNLIIRKITATLPQYSDVIVSHFLQQLEATQPEPGESSDISTISIIIYIIDNL